MLMYRVHLHARALHSREAQHNRTALQRFVLGLLSPGNKFISDPAWSKYSATDALRAIISAAPRIRD
jgi:hypothetical protein